MTHHATIGGGSTARLMIGLLAVTVFSAFEHMAIGPILPMIGADLGGLGQYGLAYAASLASSIVGMAAMGMAVDRGRIAAGFVVSGAMFAGGLLVMALSGSMAVFVAGRLVQGLGTGGLAVACYAAIAVGFPVERHRPMIGWLASAWLLPVMVGPLVAVAIAELTSWRWVFFGVALLSPIAVVIAVPPLRRAAPPLEVPVRGAARLTLSVLVGAGVLAVSAATTVSVLPTPVVILAGVVLAGIGLVVLLPKGFFRAARGLPAAVLARATGAAAVYSIQAYLPVVFESRYADGAWISGIVLTASGIGWAMAAVLSARMQRTLSSTAATRIGAFGVLMGAVAATLAIGMGWHPVVLGAVWAAVGAAMGVLSPGAAAIVIAADDARGDNTSAITISETALAAFGIAIGGVLVGSFAGEAGFVLIGVIGIVFALFAAFGSTRTAAAGSSGAAQTAGNTGANAGVAE